LVTLVIITFRLALNDANYDDPDDRADHCRRPHHCCDGAAPGYDCDDCYCCDGGGCVMFARVSVNASGVENCCVLSVPSNVNEIFGFLSVRHFFQTHRDARHKSH